MDDKDQVLALNKELLGSRMLPGDILIFYRGTDDSFGIMSSNYMKLYSMKTLESSIDTLLSDAGLKAL